MDVEVTVRNYRCFSDTPVRFSLRRGLQALVGVNNSGKSCLLRLFYELRNIFAAISSQQNVWTSLTGAQQAYGLMPLVKDRDEIFHDRNGSDVVVGFEMRSDPVGGVPTPSRFEIVIPRGTNN